MTCQNCINQIPGRMVQHGFTGCAKAPIYESFSPVFERQCKDFSQADAAILKTREAWLK